MADSVRQILVEFVTDVRDMGKGLDQAQKDLEGTDASLDVTSKKLGVVKTAAIAAGAAAAAMAAKWAIEGIGIATDAKRIEENFNAVVGSTQEFDHEIEELAGHMGLAQHEAQALLADASALGQSMGMSQQEANKFSKEMFALAGDMAAFNPEVGNAEDAMNDLIKAANGSAKGMAKWDVSIKNAEVTARALAQTGKASAGDLTQEDKARATLTLTMEKQAAAQGQLSSDIADGSTEVKEAKADIDDMQVAVGEALMPVKKLALQGFLILADVLIALEPAIAAIGELLTVLLEILQPVLDLIRMVAQAFGILLGAVTKFTIKALDPLIKSLQTVSKWVKDLLGLFPKLGNALPKWLGGGGQGLKAFHSGGVVPGPAGQSVPIMAQGGETVGRPSKGGGGAGGGTTVIVNVNVTPLSNPMDTARAISDLLVEYTQSNGAVAIKTKETV